jgi:hypothetical protein
MKLLFSKIRSQAAQLTIKIAGCLCFFIPGLLIVNQAYSQGFNVSQYNIEWKTPSKNSSESMPCGGGDIGLNVWVEKGDILFYVSRSGTFDENNGFLKLGRVRITLSPNPFIDGDFSQVLHLEHGNVEIVGKSNNVSVKVLLWADVFKPVIHAQIEADKPVTAEAAYESWRFEDYLLKPGENFANSLKWGPVKNITTLKDQINFAEHGVLFYHRNIDSTVFDITVRQQGLYAYRDSMYNPLKNLTFGGFMECPGMKPEISKSGKYLDTPYKGWVLKSEKPLKKYNIQLTLNIRQTPDTLEWKKGLFSIRNESLKDGQTAYKKTLEWWNQFWNRSWIEQPVNDARTADNKTKAETEWSVFQNYQLFRYMLGCNAYGNNPTKFNGGLFTVDPVFTDTSKHFTPDYRNWCGGVMTAQNQRLVYFPMIKSGDFDMMESQFSFYQRALGNAELRSRIYWGHKGACFTEQMENFGLPNSAEYNWKRPDYYDKGLEYNAWLEYLWDTSLEFCFMMLEKERYTGADISQYIPFIKSCLVFFDEHYQYLARHRGNKALDGDGHLILYPGSGAETFKMANNSTSTIAALKTVLSRLLELPDKYLNSEERQYWSGMLKHIPPITFREFDGHKTISPAKSWERINNIETTQLYPVFPWGIYGVGKPDLEIARNTWAYDTLALEFRSHIGWKQDNIWAARLGLTDEAYRLALLKFKDSGRRFPAFWGPGFDWVPDHNWGGSAMIGLQEMLMQTDGAKIMLFPAWPKTSDVHFKLHAPYNTTVEAELKDGKLEMLKVFPETRTKDVVNMLDLGQ